MKSVLVAVDFSSPSIGALKEAARLAKAERASLAVLHVVDRHAIEDLRASLADAPADLAASVLSGARDRLASALAETGVRGVETRTEAKVGTPLAEIVEACRAGGPDLLVIGARGVGHPDGADIGGLAAALVHKAPTRVLVVRAGGAGPYRRVVAGVDLSDGSRAAVEQAAEFARRDGASLEVLHAYAPPWEAVHWHAPTTQTEPGYRERYLTVLREALEGFVAPLRLAVEGVKTTTTLVEAHGAARGVARHLASSGADLVVVGTHGRSALAHVLLGSVAESIVRTAPCSALVVKPKPASKS